MMAAILPLALSTLFCGAGRAQSTTGLRHEARAPLPISQREINECAASLEAVRIVIIDSTGLRGKNEELKPYLNRVSAALPGEAPATYRERVRQYVQVIDDAARATKRIRVVLAISDQSLANATLWKRAARDAGYLAIRAKRTDLAGATGDAKRLGHEFSETILVVLSLLDSLRDARP
jgi:hypothetical protein